MACYETDNVAKDMTSSKSGEFTLYVNDLPGELNEKGLLQIFNHYGHVKGHFYRSNVTWAYITYGTYLEAENAIKDLNNVPPLRLKVSFAKEKSSARVEFTKASGFKDTIEQVENYNVTNIPLASKPFTETRRRNPLNIFKTIESNRGIPQHTYTENDDLLYPYPSDSYTYNPYENAEPYASTNTLWTRGVVTITQDGKRHVAFGRGYTKYEIPDPDPNVPNQINAVYEKRNSGLYEYGKDILQDAIGKCKTCSKRTKFTCQKCHTFYCCKSCQVADWPQHKFECETIPALVTGVRSMPISQSNTEGATHIRNLSNIQIPLRRPKKFENITLSSEPINNISKQDTNDKSGTPPNKNGNNKNSNYSHIKSSNQQNVQKTDVAESQGIFKQNVSPLRKIPLEKDVHSGEGNSEKLKTRENIKKQFSAMDVQKMENDISFIKCTFLSKIKFTDVKIIVTDNKESWVQKVEDEGDITELMISLQEEANKSQKVKPVLDKLYAVKYEDLWHRALVKSLNPLTVHLIDYGDDVHVETDDFRETDKYKDIPRYSAKIRLSDTAYEKHKNLRYEDIISVKMISIDANEVINVKVKDESDAPMLNANRLNDKPLSNAPNILPNNDKTAVSSETCINEKISNTFNQLKSVVNAMIVGDKGILEVHVELKKNVYSITLLPHNATSDYEKLLTDLPTMCVESAKHSNHSPKVGELICGERVDGDWLRGYILSQGFPLKMVIIDEARIMSINKTVACPEQFLHICAFGAVCQITDATCKFNAGDQYNFKVVTKASNNQQHEIELEISKDNDRVKAIVKPWVPEPEQKGVQYAELRSGSEVCLTAYRSHMLLFARSLDTTEVEHYNRVMQNVAKCAQRSPCLQEPPVVGQMVIAQYTDDNFYRAIVTKVEDDKIAISYVDFGNIEVTNLKKLKSLNDDLKQLRSCTTKVILKDVPKDMPMTKEVSDYLSHLVGAEVPLICTFEGIPSKDGVHLKLHDGENINKTINELLVPTSKETVEEDKTCYMADDLSPVDLGNVGDIIEVLVLYSLDDSYKYAVCSLDYDLMTHVFDTMPKKMTSYCESSDHYIPRENELCLARYEGGWYRATCIRRNYTPSQSAVFFMDFGNTEFVKHTDIRIMPKEFITPKALANVCNIINMGPTDSNGRFSSTVEKRISELVAPDSTVTIKIIDHDLESGVYNVELPLVRDQLSKEGLL